MLFGLTNFVRPNTGKIETIHLHPGKRIELAKPKPLYIDQALKMDYFTGEGHYK